MSEVKQIHDICKTKEPAQMIIAHRKRKENIVEYLLYMWQVEDLIRACDFDMNKIETHIIAQYEQPENIKKEIREWYNHLIEMMRIEGVKEHGHVQINKNITAELTDLHIRLLKDPQETIYGSLYYRTLPAIVQLRAKSGEEDLSEIETCITAVYGYFLLKMQGKEISADTEGSVKQISKFLAFLSAKYQDEKQDQ